MGAVMEVVIEIFFEFLEHIIRFFIRSRRKQCGADAGSKPCFVIRALATSAAVLAVSVLAVIIVLAVVSVLI